MSAFTAIDAGRCAGLNAAENVRIRGFCPTARGVGTVWDGMVMMALSLYPGLGSRLGIPENHTVGYAMVFGEPAVEYYRTVQRGPAKVHFVK